jgi:hypothetical protein
MLTSKALKGIITHNTGAWRGPLSFTGMRKLVYHQHEIGSFTEPLLPRLGFNTQIEAGQQGPAAVSQLGPCGIVKIELL